MKWVAIFKFLETTSPFSTSIVLQSKFVLFEKNGLQNFQKFLEDAPEIIKYKKQRNYAVNLNRKIEAEYFQFLCFLHFIISGLFEISERLKLNVSDLSFSILLW